MDIATYAVSDVGSKRRGPSSAAALRDQSLGTVTIAHADTDRSPMTDDGQATAGQRVVDAGRLHLDLARVLRPTLAVKVPWNVLLPLSAHRPITPQTLSRLETSQ